MTPTTPPLQSFEIRRQKRFSNEPASLPPPPPPPFFERPSALAAPSSFDKKIRGEARRRGSAPPVPPPLVARYPACYADRCSGTRDSAAIDQPTTGLVADLFFKKAARHANSIIGNRSSRGTKDSVPCRNERDELVFILGFFLFFYRPSVCCARRSGFLRMVGWKGDVRLLKTTHLKNLRFNKERRNELYRSV